MAYTLVKPSCTCGYGIYACWTVLLLWIWHIRLLNCSVTMDMAYTLVKQSGSLGCGYIRLSNSPAPRDVAIYACQTVLLPGMWLYTLVKQSCSQGCGYIRLLNSHVTMDMAYTLVKQSCYYGYGIYACLKPSSLLVKPHVNRWKKYNYTYRILFILYRLI